MGRGGLSSRFLGGLLRYSICIPNHGMQRPNGGRIMLCQFSKKAKIADQIWTAYLYISFQVNLHSSHPPEWGGKGLRPPLAHLRKQPDQPPTAPIQTLLACCHKRQGMGRGSIPVANSPALQS